MIHDLWRILSSPQCRKAQVAILALILSAATGGLLPPDVAVWVIMGINALTAAGVFVVPNTCTPILEPVVEAPVEIYRGNTVG